MSTRPLPHPSIAEISAYVAGESTAPGTDRILRLASNEGALGPSPKAVAAYLACANELHRYPDSGQKKLRQALALQHQLNEAQVVCGAGSDELISFLASCYSGPGDEIIYTEHGFLMYPIAARVAGANPVRVPDRGINVDVDAILNAVNDRTRIIFLANPNNPTGTMLPINDVMRLHDKLPLRVLLVIDAAYAEYVDRDDYSSGLELVEKHSNIVVLRTFSKIYGLASLRIGWGYFPLEIAEVLNKVRGPFNIGTAAIEAAVAALEDAEFVQKSRQLNQQVRTKFTEQVQSLGLKIHPSVANFLLVSFSGLAKGKDNAESARLFLKMRGILVRQVKAYGLPDCLRVTVGTEEDMNLVADALRSFLNE